MNFWKTYRTILRYSNSLSITAVCSLFFHFSQCYRFLRRSRICITHPNNDNLSLVISTWSENSELICSMFYLFSWLSVEVFSNTKYKSIKTPFCFFFNLSFHFHRCYRENADLNYSDLDRYRYITASEYIFQSHHCCLTKFSFVAYFLKAGPFTIDSQSGKAEAIGHFFDYCSETCSCTSCY